jgi:GNAT superfamily N-acetyltransferase
LYVAADWPADRAVIDCFDELPVRHVVDLFTAVGFGSPPSWVKPYQVLSNGERFRCDLARALACSFKGARIEERGSSKSNSLLTPRSSPLVAFDEFTSVVDRNVAKVCSAAIAKGIRRGHLPCRFVAVTCHYDIAEWLEPDWILDMATCQLARSAPGSAGGPFRRPKIELEIHRCGMAAWQLFKRHHYLSGSLPVAARCYLTTWEGIPVNFCATVPVITKRGHRRFTRIVTLPDYQGIGIGMRAIAAVAELHRREGLRINVTSSHPALIRHCRRSPQWRAVNVKKTGGSGRANPRFPTYRSAAGRAVVSFEYVGKGVRCQSDSMKDAGCGMQGAGILSPYPASRILHPPISDT